MRMEEDTCRTLRFIYMNGTFTLTYVHSVRFTPRISVDVCRVGAWSSTIPALPISSSKSTAEGNMKRNCYDRVGIVREQFVFANVELLPSSLFICFFFLSSSSLSIHVWAFFHYCISFLMINVNSFRNEFKLIIIYFLINFCKINY